MACVFYIIIIIIVLKYIYVCVFGRKKYVLRLERGVAMSSQHEDLIFGFDSMEDAEKMLMLLKEAHVDHVLHQTAAAFELK
jgi:hypothetical protein